MTFLTLSGNEGKKTGFVSVDKANFKKKVLPGHKLEIEAHLKSYKRGIAKGEVVGYINKEFRNINRSDSFLIMFLVTSNF
jgi:3-hydroxyacyl-[acyl-carrier-protein] dehydratase